jgi:hypothetical protein
MHVIRDRQYPEIARVMHGTRLVESHIDDPQRTCSDRDVLRMAHENERAVRSWKPLGPRGRWKKR